MARRRGCCWPNSRKGKTDASSGARSRSRHGWPRCCAKPRPAAVDGLFDRLPQIAKRFRAATKHLDLDPDATPYALRHSSIVRMLLAGVPTRVVAAHHDTSVAMLEDITAATSFGDPSDALTRKTLLDLDPPSSPNVVPIGRKP